MNRVIITAPDGCALPNESTILDLIEPGAGLHALMIRYDEADRWTEVHHSRLGVTIRREKDVS